MKKLLALLLAALLLLAAGCGTQTTPPPTEDPAPETQEPLLLPEDFPLELYFSSGAGGWSSELTLQRDGSFAGLYHDSDMGSIGDSYPGGTVYLCEFEGRFGSFRQVDDTTLSLTLEELTTLTTEDETWIKDGVRYIGATPYGLEGGTEFHLYLPEKTTSDLSDSARSGWPLAETDSETLSCYGLHNVASDCVFYDWSYWFPEGTPDVEDSKPAEEPPAESAPVPPPVQEPPAPEVPAMVVYDIEGTRIRLPMEHTPQLLVTTLEDYCAEELDPHSLPLLTVREKASVEAAEADFGDSSGIGFLFGISRMDQVGFEELAQYDIPGCSVFARDETHYYAVTYPTDVQFYRSDGNYETDLQDWEILNGLKEDICLDIIEQNSLTPFSHHDLYSQAFTYQGNHIYVNFYPYFTVDGSHDSFRTLVLSQPATQGAGGIWCVERMLDEFGTTYLIFPQKGVPASEYYAERQTAHDGGEETHLLTPLSAAENFLRENGWFSGELAEGSLEEMSAIDSGYTEVNRKLHDVIPSLLTGNPVTEERLLDCIGSFREDTWGVLGRSYYGSDWWPPLLAALEKVALGEGQEMRCESMMRFYLTCYGRYEEAVREILRQQQAEAPEAFAVALERLETDEQTRITANTEPNT